MMQASLPRGSAAISLAATEPGSHTRAYRLSRWWLLVPLGVTLDAFKFIGRGGPPRYAFLLLPVLPVILYRLRSPSRLIRRPVAGDLFLGGLGVFALLGTTYALTVHHTLQTARPMVTTMALAFLYLLVLDSPTDEEVGRIVRTLAGITALYVLIAAVVNIGLIPPLIKYGQYRNSLFALVTGGLGAAFVLRRWRLLGILAALEVVNFIGYPSATSILCLITMVGTLYMTGARSPRVRASWLVAAVFAMAMLSVVNLQTTLGVFGEYFLAVDKYNATSVRLSVWLYGLHQFIGSPLIGQAFAGSTIASGLQTGAWTQFPYHNDLILFLAEGGILGLGLFLLWVVSTEMLLLGRFTAFRDAGRSNRANLIRVFLVMFNAFVVTSVFNPTFSPISPAATLYTLYGLVMLLGAPEDSRPPGDRGSWLIRGGSTAYEAHQS